MRRNAARSVPLLGEHKLLVAMAVLAVTYCLGAPIVANILGHFGY